jgi:hypothetical protein
MSLPLRVQTMFLIVIQTSNYLHIIWLRIAAVRGRQFLKLRKQKICIISKKFYQQEPSV